VDRIRDTDIVLVREDPANPDVPTATRVIPLRPDDVLAAR
jgi:type IV pilus assembly protein PilP